MTARVLVGQPLYPIDRNDKPLLTVTKICKELGIEPFAGEGHLILTLWSIIGSGNNATEIREYTVRAVSDFILVHPQWANSVGLCHVHRLIEQTPARP